MYNFTFLLCLQMEEKETHQRKCDSLKPDAGLKELTIYTVGLAGSEGYNLPLDLGKGIKIKVSGKRASHLWNVFSNFNKLKFTAENTPGQHKFSRSENMNEIEKNSMLDY